MDCGLERGEDQLEDGDGRYLLWGEHAESQPINRNCSFRA
jgi:hypothetical protein